MVTFLADPGSIFLFTGNVLVFGEQIMQYLLGRYANGKNTQQQNGNRTPYDLKECQNMLLSCKLQFFHTIFNLRWRLFR